MESDNILIEGVLSKTFNIFMVYKFLRLLTTPFNKTDAYKLGIIDANGEILKKYNTLESDKERDAYTYFHRLVWKLKRLLAKLPFGKTTLASYATALWFLKEHTGSAYPKIEQSFLEYVNLEKENIINEEPKLKSGQYTLKEDICGVSGRVLAESGSAVYINNKVVDNVFGVNVYEGHINKRYIPITVDNLVEESPPVNSAGGGQVAGIGVGPKGEPGYPSFMGCRVFKVNSDNFHKCLPGKKKYDRYSKYVGIDEAGEEIRQYARKNHKAGIILQNEHTHEMIFLRRPAVN